MAAACTASARLTNLTHGHGVCGAQLLQTKTPTKKRPLRPGTLLLAVPSEQTTLSPGGGFPTVTAQTSLTASAMSPIKMHHADGGTMGRTTYVSQADQLAETLSRRDQIWEVHNQTRSHQNPSNLGESRFMSQRTLKLAQPLENKPSVGLPKVLLKKKQQEKEKQQRQQQQQQQQQ